MRTIQREEPDLFDADLRAQIVKMFDEAVDCETQFAEDILGGGVAGLSVGPCASTSNIAPTSASRRSACRSSTARPIR